MSPAKPDLKSRVITCLNKLSDRDTVAIATTELESIARTLSQDSFSSFITCIHNTDSSSKSPVRKQCVSLLTLLSHSHGDTLSPHLSRMVSTVVRRLRDPDTAVRSACVDAAAAMSKQISKPPFSVFLKPLMEALTTEQDANSQIGAALCLAAAVEAAPELEIEQMRKVLPRLGKLAKNEGFKAKAALLTLIGSVVDVGGASSRSVLDWWIPCIVEFLGSEDWAVRKAAAEALAKVAITERDLAAAYKVSCLASLESRRFDKVKIVRETMNRTMELWKLVAGNSEEVSVASQSSTGIGPNNSSGSSTPPSCKTSRDISPRIPRTSKIVPTNRSTPSECSLASPARKGIPVRSNDRNTNTVKLLTLDHKKPLNCKVEVTRTQPHNSNEVCEDESRGNDNVAANLGGKESGGNSRPETKRSLFSAISDEKKHRFSGLRSGSRVVPIDDGEHQDSGILACTGAVELYDNAKEDEDLSLIHKQLLQIENQQSNLLELLQRFMGSSQNGINSLETRVQDIETTLDEISHDLVSRRRIPNADFAYNTCCKLPGSEFLSSKFWRKTEDQSGSYQSRNVGYSTRDRTRDAESCKQDDKRFQKQDKDGCTDSWEKVEYFSNRRAQKTVQNPTNRLQFHHARGSVGA